MSYADDLFIRMCQDIIDNGLQLTSQPFFTAKS